MKKFIKDWWPLLLFAGWWLWKRKGEKSKSGNTTVSIAEELMKKGFTKIDQTCPVCGSEMYKRYSYSPTDLTKGTLSANLTVTCSNPKCVECQFPQWNPTTFQHQNPFMGGECVYGSPLP